MYNYLTEAPLIQTRDTVIQIYDCRYAQESYMYLYKTPENSESIISTTEMISSTLTYQQAAYLQNSSK